MSAQRKKASFWLFQINMPPPPDICWTVLISRGFRSQGIIESESPLGGDIDSKSLQMIIVKWGLKYSQSGGARWNWGIHDLFNRFPKGSASSDSISSHPGPAIPSSPRNKWSHHQKTDKLVSFLSRNADRHLSRNCAVLALPRFALRQFHHFRTLFILRKS